MTNQEDRHASFRAISGTTSDYNSDSFAAFLAEGATETGSYNGAMIEWLQIRTGSSDDNLDNLKALFASDLGVTSWDEVGLFDPDWSPADLDNGLLWLDASDTDASNIVESGGLVSQWNDKFPSGNDVTQTNGSFQPVTNSATQNGLNVIDFSAFSWMDIPNLGLDTLTDASVYMVFLSDSGTSGSDCPICFGTGSEGRWEGATTFKVQGSLNIRTNNTTIFTITQDAFHQVGVLTDSGTTTSRVDGTQDTTAGGQGAWNTGAGDYGLMAAGGARYLKGKVAEVVITGDALTAGERTSLESYFASKWGI